MYRYSTQLQVLEALKDSGKATLRLSFAKPFTTHKGFVIAREVLVEDMTVAAVLDGAWRVQV